VTYRGTVGLGITTWQRPEMYRECRESIQRHLSHLVDFVMVVQDGGESYIHDNPKWWRSISHGDNRGWSVAKNTCLDRLARLGCDHLFMIEDDTLVTSPEAITGYVDAALASGHHYLTAHPWGEATTRMVEHDGLVTYWAYCGSWWTYMSETGLLRGGAYDSTLGGIMGDIELPQRWQLQGLTSGWGRLPDATGSEGWVRPRCLTVDQSMIASQPGWAARQEFLLRWWAETMPETLPCEMRPAREGNWSRKCDDVRSRASSGAVDNAYI
jgi:hypothetical protein